MKVLISRGFGAGWSTWSSGECAKLMRTYQPLIIAIEKDEKITESHPAVISMLKECKEKFDEEPYLGGLDGLCVEEVAPPFQIHEYDGAESIVIPGEDDNWIME